MAYIIATELATEALSHSQRPYKVIDSVHIFLHCVAIYSEQCETCDRKEKPSTWKRPDHQQLLENVRNKFHRWLRDSSNWLQLKETLKVFLIFCLK